MIAVMTRRQVNNGQFRAMGIKPELTYHWHVVVGDRVRVQVVEQEPFEVEQFLAVVESVEHCNQYTLVHYVREDGECGSAWLWHDGPPDWGVVEFKVVAAVPRRPVVEDDRLTDRDARDELRPLHRPRRCPTCGTMCDAKPKSGWPCLSCRVATRTSRPAYRFGRRVMAKLRTA